MNSHGFVRIAAAVPRVYVADPEKNVAEMVHLARQAAGDGVQLLVFPELGITGYTCGDLFKQQTLLEAAENALAEFLMETEEYPLISIVGLPFTMDGQRFNVAAVVNNGRVLALIPKQYIPNYREFYELRWFSPGVWTKRREAMVLGGRVPFGNDILVEAKSIEHFRMSVEICEDLWEPIPPSSHHALAGARILVNPSASNAVVAKADYRRSLVANQSARCMAAYVYTSCGVGESSADLVFDGHAIIAENGVALAESKRYARDGQLIIADVDLERIVHERSDSSFGQAVNDEPERTYRTVTATAVQALDVSTSFRRTVDPRPFVPSDLETRDARCQEVFNIQVAGLARRLEHLEEMVGKREVTIGVSGGLDSTLVMLVTAMAFDELGWDRNGIIAFTLPGFGTTKRTRGNAERLSEALRVTFREVPIVEMTLAYLRSVNHLGVDEKPHADCLHCQNSQARFRTNLLMNHGFTVGTGDLSEIALGWSTYGGDQLSMYNVNAGVPKTLVKHVVAWVAEKNQLGDLTSEILRDILATPISPELNPVADEHSDNGQKTEDILGPYDLHDFILHGMVRYGYGPEKILFLAEQAFKGAASRAQIVTTMQTFYRRFFAAQFKRNAAPDGPKVGSVSLSQRGDWRMPSDATGRLWLAAVEHISP